MICQWGPALIDANLNFSGLNPSVEPAWNGVFDKTIVGTGIWGTIWYFTGQSIISNPLIFPEKVAANWSAGYPVPNWQDNADYTMLAWNTVFSQWYLLIQEIGFGPVWIGTGSTNPLDPTGVYNLVGGTSVAPTTLSIVDSVHPNQCCPDWTTLLWGVPDFTGTQGTGNATFTPNSVASNSAHAFADSPSTTFGANRGQVQNTGSLNYNGKGCHCNAHIVQSVLDPNNLQESTGVVFITIDGNPILSYQNNGNVNTDMAFDLPDTGGVSKVVNVLVFVEVPIDNFVLIVDHENIDLQVTITNI